MHCVRCNLLHVPLEAAQVDFAYSIGVVHHTPDPPAAIGEIARLLKPDGALSVWVYPPEYWGHPLKAAVSRRIRAYLLGLELEAQVRFIRRWLMPLGRLQRRVARFGPLKLLLAPLFLANVPRHDDWNEMFSTVIDYYLPEYIHTYTDDELREIFEDHGLAWERLGFPTAARGRPAGRTTA